MTKHTLGYQGHRQFTPHAIKALEQIGAQIHHLGGGRYQLSAAAGAVDLETFCPTYIAHDNGVFDRKNLVAFMDWMNQPSAAFLAHKTGKKQNAPQNKAARQAMLGFMNFALTGHAELQDKARDFLEKETAECHAETEDAIRQNDEWTTENEFGNNESFASALPNTSIDPARGFTLFPHPDFLAAQDGQGQSAAQSLFRDAINAATRGRHNGAESAIVLSAKELERFYDVASAADLETMVARLRFETAVQTKAEQIQTRARALVLQQARAPQDEAAAAQNSRRKLDALLGATSAFTPVMRSQYLQQSWWRSHVTESWFADKNDTPYGELAEEYAVFTALMHAYSQKDDLVPAQLQAITEEFYPLLVTTDKVREIIENAAQKARVEMPQGISAFRQAFDDARSTHMTVAEKFLPDHHQEALAGLDHTLKSGAKAFVQSLTVDPLKGGAEAGWDVTKDVWNYLAEDPKQAALVIAGGFALYALSSNTGVDAGTLAANNDILMLGMDGLIPTAAPKELSAEAAQTQSFHYDVGFSLKNSIKDMLSGDLASPYYVYKHFTNYMMVEGTEWSMDKFENAMQYTARQMGFEGNPNTTFSAGAKSTMYALASFYFSLNLFQNFSHTGFWAWAGKKGFTHGGKGALQIVELAAPLMNPLYQAGVNIAELTPLKKKAGLAERLMRITQEPDTHFDYQGHLDLDSSAFDAAPASQQEKPLLALAEAAQERMALESTLPAPVREANISLEIGGADFGRFGKRGALRHAFTIGAQNLQPALDALAAFDHALETMASQIGADEGWYNIFLKDKIAATTKALRAYQDNGDLGALQTGLQAHMLDVIGAQIRQSGGESPIWEDMTGAAVEGKTRTNLHRQANRNYGQLKRAQTLEGYANERLLEEKTFGGHIALGAKTRGVALWDGMVSAARTVQSMDNVVPVLPASIAVAGTAAACVALDQFGMGNAVTDAGSHAAGIAASSTVMTGIFVGYNWFIDDVLFVHLGTGVGLMAGGIAARLGYNQIKPVVAAAAENQTLRAVANAAFSVVEPLVKPVASLAQKGVDAVKGWSQSLREANERRGQDWTRRHRENNKDAYERLLLARAPVHVHAGQFPFTPDLD